MKNLQTLIPKSIITFLLVVSFSLLHGQSLEMKQADSLFKAKQYTQSAELYQSVFQKKNYTPAMLLKLAWIEEGLGKIGLTLYYLRLYYLATDDSQALVKMGELATKYNLSGYALTDTDRLTYWFAQNRTMVLSLSTLLLLLNCCWIFYKKNKQLRVTVSVWLLAIGSVVVLVINNYTLPRSVIVKSDNTYLMSGPSAGASVVAVVTEGHQLKKMAVEDTWVKVKWMDKWVYAKADALLEVAL
ncbi:MAG: hypothetical protein JST43_09740 [Bacteroidetes bacterium]|nr:hypothetical protein [Bacteroidota bacterium]